MFAFTQWGQVRKVTLALTAIVNVWPFHHCQSLVNGVHHQLSHSHTKVGEESHMLLLGSSFVSLLLLLFGYLQCFRFRNAIGHAETGNDRYCRKKHVSVVAWRLRGLTIGNPGLDNLRETLPTANFSRQCLALFLRHRQLWSNCTWIGGKQWAEPWEWLQGHHDVTERAVIAVATLSIKSRDCVSSQV